MTEQPDPPSVAEQAEAVSNLEQDSTSPSLVYVCESVCVCANH